MKPEFADASSLRAAFQDYVKARQRFLETIGTPTSCRDPLAEFSERLAAEVLDASIASSRVQKGYDLIRRSTGRKVQVKYLCNPSERWINEHHIRFPEGVEEYALVVFERLHLRAILVFPRENLEAINAVLKKRHGRQATELQFTRRNFQTICMAQDKFKALGVEIYLCA